MIDPPEIAWIRAVRHKMAAECGYDPHQLYERARQLEQQMPEKVVGYEHPGKVGRAMPEVRICPRDAEAHG
jgi:hypothetical protein